MKDESQLQLDAVNQSPARRLVGSSSGLKLQMAQISQAMHTHEFAIKSLAMSLYLAEAPS
jgi:hypothetical protein